MKKYFITAVSLLLMLLLLTYPEIVSSAVVSALRLCAFTVIPTLFPFAVTSNVLIKSNSFSQSSAAAKIFSKVFNCSPAMFSVFISGLAGGYPIGAISAVEMYKNGLCSRNDAQKALSFCNFCGPSFIISAVGVSMLGNSRCGIYLYVCHFISAILTGIILRPYFCGDTDFEISSPKNSVSLITSLTAAIKDSTSSMLSVCSCIVFFSALNAVLSAIKADCTLITALLEMTSGAKRIISSEIPSVTRLPLLSACLAFGGLSVHSQVMSVCAISAIDTKPFFTGKCIHTLISFFITLLSKDILGSKAVFSDKTVISRYPYVFISVFVIFFIFVLKKSRNNMRSKL